MAEKLTNSYETIFIIDAALDEEAITAVKEKFTSLISANGTLNNIDEWGKRRLAYPINDLEEGYYVFVAFNAQPALPAELDRVFKITDGIMRSIIVTLDR